MSLEHERLIRKLESVSDLTQDELAALRSLPMRLQTIDADVAVVQEGDRPTECCLLLDGFMVREKIMPAGRRQIMTIHVPGDMPDLQCLHLRVVDHGVAALGPAGVAFIPHVALRSLIAQHPGVGAALWRDSHITAAVFREWIVNVGSRPAYNRAAHLFCEFFVKMQAVGLTDGDHVRFPGTQADLADCMGLSIVHANRVIQQLRAAGLIVLTTKSLTIPDLAALKAVAEFDPIYLHLQKEAAWTDQLQAGASPPALACRKGPISRSYSASGGP